ncbi:hypothetical protein IscW_ISCW018624 [Ixodes scapularis]|uniref:Uncharacterized protein n=1 Tax=Ixodes scapularis TaxID=6945 RepID=B7PLV5_IXOSC|nr:hypothetical protein IscW_ISCW018624 [Ixodes scapularis]|eukprot:XP_002434753.1 hypothetical protein IscW_ISCW018624 [Ixodes scapularis]
MGVRSSKPELRKRAYSSDRRAVLTVWTSYKLPLSVAARTCPTDGAGAEFVDGNGRSTPDAPAPSSSAPSPRAISREQAEADSTEAVSRDGGNKQKI